MRIKNNFKFAVGILWWGFFVGFGCGKSSVAPGKSNAPQQANKALGKDFYIYTTGMGYQEQGRPGNSVRIFNEFVRTHANLLAEYSVHVVHFDPEFRHQGIAYWQSQFGELPFLGSSDQRIEAEYFDHDVHHPHLVIDGADIYGQKVVRANSEFKLVTVLSGAIDPDSPEGKSGAKVGTEKSEIKEIYIPLWGQDGGVKDLLFCIDKNGNVQTLLDASLLLKPLPKDISEGSSHFGYDSYKAGSLYGTYLTGEKINPSEELRQHLESLCK